MSIHIACPNLSLDRTIEIEQLAIGGVHRSRRGDARGGGKGVNVARALAALGAPARITGILSGRTGSAVRGLLEDEGIRVDAIQITGETRSCLTVIAANGVTVFNESGPRLDAHGWLGYRDLVEEHLGEGAVFVCSGSFPPGAPGDAAAQLISFAKSRGCTVVLDASGVQLENGLEAGPDLVKPNLHEALGLLHDTKDEPVESGPDALPRAREAAAALVRAGARAVVVSAGAAGAALATRTESHAASPPPVRVVNPIGAGDCMVAALAARLERGLPLDGDALRVAIAVAAAGCETFAAGVLDAARVDELLGAPA